MRWRSGLLGFGLLALTASGVSAADPPSGTGCTKTLEIDGGTNAWGVVSEVSARPIRICSVDLLASGGTNAWAEVFESPTTTLSTHAQAKRKAEPGVAVQYESVAEFFGETGRLTFEGVGAVVVRGRLLVHFQD